MVKVFVPTQRRYNLALVEDIAKPIRRGHKVFAYVVDGERYFDPERNAFTHEVVGANYFDMNR